MVLPLKVLLGAVPDRPDLTVRLHIDDDVMTIVSTRDSLEIRYGDASLPADLVVQTGYESFLDVAEGLVPAKEFIARHVEVIDGSDNAGAFFALMGAAITQQR
jgi:hypothetical protein